MYSEAKERYAALGVDTDGAITKLKTVPVSLHCWHCLLYTSPSPRD